MAYRWLTSLKTKKIKQESQTEEEISRYNDKHGIKQGNPMPSHKLMKNMLPFLHQIHTLLFEEPRPPNRQLTPQPALSLKSYKSKAKFTSAQVAEGN